MLIHLRKYSEAADALKNYTQRNPGDQEAWYLLRKTYLQLSEDSLGKINQIDPGSVVAHEVAGEIDESMHNYDGALVEYKKAAEMAPHRPGTHLHLANAFWSIGKWESARGEFEAELTNDPNNCSALWKLGNTILEANGAPADALSQLNKAVERCPELMQARVDRARANIKLGKPDEALPDLLLAGKDSPDEPSIHFLLASVYRSQGKTAEVQKELRTYGRLQREASEAGGAGKDSHNINMARNYRRTRLRAAPPLPPGVLRCRRSYLGKSRRQARAEQAPAESSLPFMTPSIVLSLPAAW